MTTEYNCVSSGKMKLNQNLTKMFLSPTKPTVCVMQFNQLKNYKF